MSTKITFDHEFENRKEVYKIGDWFVVNDTHLCQLKRVGLELNSELKSTLSMERVDGGSYAGYYPVKNPTNITDEEMQNLCFLNNYVKVSVEITTKPFQP